MKKLGLFKKYFAIALAFIVCLLITFEITSMSQPVRVKAATADTDVGLVEDAAVDEQGWIPTATEVLSYMQVFEYYYEQVTDNNPGISEKISLDDFIDLYYMQADPIQIFSEKMALGTFVQTDDTAVNIDKNIVVNSPDGTNTSGILVILSPDQNYILGKNIGAANYTNASYFRRAPIISQAFDYAKIAVGDIIYESNAAVPTNHVAFVNNTAQPSDYGNYVQTIEAVAGGVQYGFLDDERITRFGVCIYRIYRATELGVVAKAKEFILQQVGKDYPDVETMLEDFTKTKTDINSTRWYCSELIFAAYYYGGMDICSNRNFDFVPESMPCLPVYLTQGMLSGQIYLNTEYLQLSISSFHDALWNNGYWTIRISNLNYEPVSVYYNSKMCFADDARDWNGLSDIADPIEIAARSSATVNIYQNWFATSVVVSYRSGDYRYITYGTELSKVDYSMNVANNKIPWA